MYRFFKPLLPLLLLLFILSCQQDTEIDDEAVIDEVLPEGMGTEGMSSTATLSPPTSSVDSSTVSIVNPSNENLSDEELLNNEIANLIIEKTNAYRVGLELTSLTENEELNALAKYHNDNMIELDFFSHSSPDGMDLVDRAEQFNVTYRSISENLAITPWFSSVVNEQYDFDCGSTMSAESLSSCTVLGWMRSPGHNENLIRNYGENGEIGVAVAFSEDNGVRTAYATQVFRQPR